MKNSKVLWSSVVIVIALIGLGAVFHKPAYTPHTDTFTFERKVDIDEGRELNPADLVTTNGVRLLDIYSATEKKFTPERFSRYGADRTQLGGVGLTVNFITDDRGKKVTKTFHLPGWTAFERPTTRPNRRTEVEDAEPRFAKSLANFIAPAKLEFRFAVVLDTTEGVNSDLARRAQEVINNTKAAALAGKGHAVVVNLYHVTESSYQGSRRRVDLYDLEQFKEAREWFTNPQTSEKKSSVLRGLKAIFTEVEGYTKKTPQVHVFTDGLENLPELSVYKTPELLDNEAGWSKLDTIADLSKLKLAGVEIHLHPLPSQGRTEYEKKMEKGLNYLADRLTKAGAKTTIEPL